MSEQYPHQTPLQSQYDPNMRGTMEPHRGTMILVFGILGIVCCFIFGIVAWVMGSGDLKKIDAGQMDPTGRGLTQAGMICGMISVVLLIVGILLQFIFGVALIPLRQMGG